MGPSLLAIGSVLEHRVEIHSKPLALGALGPAGGVAYAIRSAGVLCVRAQQLFYTADLARARYQRAFHRHIDALIIPSHSFSLTSTPLFPPSPIHPPFSVAEIVVPGYRQLALPVSPCCASFSLGFHPPRLQLPRSYKGQDALQAPEPTA